MLFRSIRFGEPTRFQSAAISEEEGTVSVQTEVTKDRSQAGARKTTDTNQEMLSLLVESVKDYAIIILDAQGFVATWTPAAERLNGYRADEIVGKHFSAFYTKEDVSAGKCERELEVAAQEGRFEDEGWRVRKDGSRFWANVVITALRSEDGTLRGFGKVTRDWTAQRRAEERARGFVESAADAIVIVNPKGEIVLVNSQTEALFGYSRAELLGQAVEKLIPERFRSQHPGHRNKYFVEPRPRSMGANLSLYALHKDGHEFPVEISLSPVETEEGTMVTSSIRDATERRQTEEKLRKQSKEIMEMATVPVVQVWEGVLLVPLIGTLDSSRTQQLMERLLQRLTESQSAVALLDITGVPTIDTQTAQHLIETIKAVRYIGAEVVLTGVRPVIAQTLVHLGVDLSTVITRSSLRAGLREALNLLGLEVRSSADERIQ